MFEPPVHKKDPDVNLWNTHFTTPQKKELQVLEDELCHFFQSSLWVCFFCLLHFLDVSFGFSVVGMRSLQREIVHQLNEECDTLCGGVLVVILGLAVLLLCSA